MSTLSLLLRSAERFHEVRCKSRAWCGEAANVCWGSLHRLLHRYKPESYYMRGPGPKWREKHHAMPANEIKARKSSKE